MKQVHILVDFLVEVSDDEKDLEALFIDIPPPTNYRVTKFDKKNMMLVVGRVVEYETICANDFETAESNRNLKGGCVVKFPCEP